MSSPNVTCISGLRLVNNSCDNTERLSDAVAAADDDGDDNNDDDSDDDEQTYTAGVSQKGRRTKPLAPLPEVFNQDGCQKIS